MTPDSKDSSKIRVLIGKPGLDGHDVGAKLVGRALRDAGMEVFYTGLRQSPEEIAQKAIQLAVQVVGLSILSGTHLRLSQGVLEQLEKQGAGDVLVIVGGNIPAADHEALRRLGVAQVFGTGTPFEDIVSFLQDKTKR